eukprot:TRINITY_DN3096_c0_g1_i7.p1 TRINITY_DN3096_c0_g1~~TRINITY_DN3096_c0_g1_i7.p1  ORF type:complete len:491 (-),score=101.92 TRINITY_DN3096_c0_g1_i7:488-1960(-)
MKYISTRGGISPLSFEDAVISGLADDGGLIIPEKIPRIEHEELLKWRHFNFCELSLEIMSKYIPQEEIPRGDLKQLVSRSFLSFAHADITPIVKVDNHYILELFHGPTFSFKDVALQFLGNLFEYILNKRNDFINVLGATSGDTGSAAIYGLRGKKRVNVFILFPKDRVSPLQEVQMTSVLDENVHCLKVRGSFDEAQTIVKKLFSDLEFKKKYHLAAINSINWSRILSQIVYYFFAYFQVLNSTPSTKGITFSVPSGNFGDVLAGYYAKKMGLPIDRLIIATNQNDILHRFFEAGLYHRAESVFATCSPSMDIQVASNFERYLYYLAGENSAILTKWMTEFGETGKLSLLGELLSRAQSEFSSDTIHEEEIISTIKKYYFDFNYLLDPHTAIGVAAGVKYMNTKGSKDSTLVCLSTAHPAKFGSTIVKAVGGKVEKNGLSTIIPSQSGEIDIVQSFKPASNMVKNAGETKCKELDADAEKVKEAISLLM